MTKVHSFRTRYWSYWFTLPGAEKVDFTAMDDKEVQDFASAVQDLLITNTSPSMKEIALANDTICWCLEANTHELRVILAEREAMKAALKQGEAELALAEAQEANHTAHAARVAAKSSKAPAPSASPAPMTTKPKAPSFVEEVHSAEPHPPTPSYPMTSAEAGPSCPCPCPQPLFLSYNSSPKASKASESEDEKVGEAVGSSLEGFMADPFDGFWIP